jgi:predicted phage terminase large subunit-like protein
MLSIKTAIERSGRVWWVAPSFSQSSMAWRELKALARQIPERVVREDARRIALPGGGEITVKSADAPDSLRGEGLDLCVLDEAAYIGELVWTDALRPALSDRKGGAVIVSTPAGFNWFHDAFMRGQEARDDWQSWQYPTSDNPLIDPEEIEAARESLSGRTFGQEYLALFVVDGALFKREWFDIVAAAPAIASRVRYWDKASGLSEAADYTAGVLMARDARGLLYVEDVVHGRWSAHERDTVMRQTAALDAERYGRVPIWIEQVFGLGQEAAQQAVRALAGYTVHTERVTKTKVERADPLAAQCEAGNVKLVRAPWNAAYLNELCSFPGGAHDDMVDASSGAFHKLAFTDIGPIRRAQPITNRWSEVGSVTPTRRGNNRWNP